MIGEGNFFRKIRFFTFTHIHKPKNNTILPSKLQILVTNANIFKYKLGRSRNSLKRVKQDTKICLSVKFIDLSHHSFPIFAPENFKLRSSYQDSSPSFTKKIIKKCLKINGAVVNLFHILFSATLRWRKEY